MMRFALIFFMLFLRVENGLSQSGTDSSLYILKMQQLANGDRSGRWPPQVNFPLPGSILPYKRIVAFYGNFYSAQMGILGQYSSVQVIEKLKAATKEWNIADTLTPVVPAIHYIAVTAQKNAGADKKYRLRMPFTEIDKALAMANEVDGILFLDIQVGHSTLQEEIPALRKYLLMPNVHLAIDPEYSMKNKCKPGNTIGTFDAADINYAAAYLAELVRNNKLTPKILVVHRFTNAMLTHYTSIVLQNEVQLVINMDGFGSEAKKKSTYYYAIFKEPVQFAGFKLFYKWDSNLMQPAEILALKPIPVYIQYQ